MQCEDDGEVGEGVGGVGGEGGESEQSFSSDPSLQSSFPSHFQARSIHCSSDVPVHWNWLA